MLAVAASDTEKLARQLLPSARAREIGGRVVALSMPVPAPMCMSLNTFCALWLIPGWDAVLRLPKPEKARMLQDPAVRADLMAQAGQSALGGMTRLRRLHHR